jgi:hypothetical protein
LQIGSRALPIQDSAYCRNIAGLFSGNLTSLEAVVQQAFRRQSTVLGGHELAGQDFASAGSGNRVDPP